MALRVTAGGMKPNSYHTVKLSTGLFAASFTDPDGNEITIRTDIPDEACADAIGAAALNAYNRGFEDARVAAIEAVRRMPS